MILSLDEAVVGFRYFRLVPDHESEYSRESSDAGHVNITEKPSVPLNPLDGEDSEISRVSLAPSIWACVAGIQGNLTADDVKYDSHNREDCGGRVHGWYVYGTNTAEIIPTYKLRKFVPDAHLTGEVWSVKPVEMTLIGRIGGDFDENGEYQMWVVTGRPDTESSFRVTAKTLYHGTTTDAADSIMKYGILPDTGDFIKDAYGIDFDAPEDDEYQDDYGYVSDDERVDLVFMADKYDLSKARNAIVHHVAKKLGKDPHSVTENDVRNHGALIRIKEVSDDYYEQHKRGDGKDHPPFTEPGDYYSSDPVGADDVITGYKLLQFFKKHDIDPTYDPSLRSLKSNLLKVVKQLLEKNVDIGSINNFKDAKKLVKEMSDERELEQKLRQAKNLLKSLAHIVEAVKDSDHVALLRLFKRNARESMTVREIEQTREGKTSWWKAFLESNKIHDKSTEITPEMLEKSSLRLEPSNQNKIEKDIEQVFRAKTIDFSSVDTALNRPTKAWVVYIDLNKLDSIFSIYGPRSIEFAKMASSQRMRDMQRMHGHEHPNVGEGTLTIGWVRYAHLGNFVWVEEIQSDLRAIVGVRHVLEHEARELQNSSDSIEDMNKRMHELVRSRQDELDALLDNMEWFLLKNFIEMHHNKFTILMPTYQYREQFPSYKSNPVSVYNELPRKARMHKKHVKDLLPTLDVPDGEVWVA